MSERGFAEVETTPLVGDNYARWLISQCCQEIQDYVATLEAAKTPLYTDRVANLEAFNAQQAERIKQLDDAVVAHTSALKSIFDEIDPCRDDGVPVKTLLATTLQCIKAGNEALQRVNSLEDDLAVILPMANSYWWDQDHTDKEQDAAIERLEQALTAKETA